MYSCLLIIIQRGGMGSDYLRFRTILLTKLIYVSTQLGRYSFKDNNNNVININVILIIMIWLLTLTY